LVAQDAAEAQGAAEAREVRFFATRSQMQALSSHARTVIGQSRPPEQEARQTEAYARRNGHGH
jgi:hypothetical protein